MNNNKKVLDEKDLDDDEPAVKVDEIELDEKDEEELEDDEEEDEIEEIPAD